MNIYLSGGMTKFGKNNFSESNDWRVEIKNDLEEFSYKIHCFNPNEHFSFLDNLEDYSDREIMNFDIASLHKSDLVIVNFNDPNSIGTACELGIAYSNHIPVLGINENKSELHPWLSNICEHIFSNSSDLLYYVKYHYVI